jgi:hypothetical protein
MTGSLAVITNGVEFQVTNTGVKIGNVITDTHTVTGSLSVSGSVTATNFTGSLLGTASFANNATSASYALVATSASFASTSSFVNTLNQNVVITGSLTVGQTTTGAGENTLILGPAPAGGAGEGGQLLLAASGGLYTSASMWDNWQNQTRLLRGTNAGSDAIIASFNMHSGQVVFPRYTGSGAFSGSATANLSVDSNGNILTTAIGSSLTGGSTNYIARWASSTTLTTGSLFDSASRIGINTITPGYSLDVNGDIRATGAVYANANGQMYFRGGDDAELWDINVANTIGVYGQQDQTVASIKLGSGGGTVSGRSGNIGINTITPTSGSLHVSGNVWANSFTGSLLGTASYASNSLTASFAQTAQTASYVLNAVSASFASTASFVTLAQTASFVQTAQTASFVQTAQTASYVLNAVSASFASTASFVTLAQTASFVQNAQTASYVLNAVSASFATSASNAITASYAFNATSASSAISASFASTASFVQNAQTASYVLNAVSASFASTASFVQNAQTASYVQIAQTASFVQTAQTASYVLNAVSSSYAATASYSNNLVVGSSLTLDATLTDYATVASSIAGSNNVFTQNTSSYTSAFFKYTVSNGGNTRAGEVVATWNGTTTEFTDFSTVDIGNTTAVTASISIVTGQVQFNIQTNSSGWRIKSLATFM